MMKTDYLQEIKDITEITKKMRATVNEAVMFNEEGDSYGEDFDERMGGRDEEMPEERMRPDMGGNGEMSVEDEGMAKLDQTGTIDQIRELTLKGMIRLCKTPEDPEYQALNKIFKMCDKSVDADVKNQEQQKPQMRR